MVIEDLDCAKVMRRGGGGQEVCAEPRRGLIFGGFRSGGNPAIKIITRIKHRGNLSGDIVKAGPEAAFGGFGRALRPLCATFGDLLCNYILFKTGFYFIATLADLIGVYGIPGPAKQ